MRLTNAPALLASLLAAGGAAQTQQTLINELSFGSVGRISNPESRGQIPNFSLQGTTRPPQVLSNKIILTPVNPGNYRGAVWSDGTLQHTEWVADVEFRASGPERGSGNLNIWLSREGSKEVGHSSIYTVGRFEGLALVVDGHGGTGGMLRGFLNDGSIDYASRGSIDDLAFGHCQFSYRNLGRPAQIKLRQSRDNFVVEIDSRKCFETDKVAMPTGYQFGVSAATPNEPDSFEVFKLVVMSERSSPGGSAPQNGKYSTRNQQPPKKDNNASPSTPKGDLFEGEVADQDADAFTTSKEQFQDVHNRMQSMNHQLSSVYRSVSRHHQLDEQRHTEIKQLIGDLKSQLARLDQVEVLQTRVKDLEKEVRGMRNDINKKLGQHERSFKGYLTDHHATLSQTMLDSMPGHKRLIALILGSQAVLVAAYVVYKRRKANSPKKYL